MEQLENQVSEIQGEIFEPIQVSRTEEQGKKKRIAKSHEIPFKQPPAAYKNSELFPANIFDILPEDHECFVYREISELIEVKKLYKNYSVLGQRAFNPKTLISILIYAYSQGVFSSRQIAEKLKYDLGFMYIGQMQKPNFRVISDFRKDNIAYFKDCFNQSVKLAMTAGLVSLGHISLDGSKFKANTSKHKAMSYGRMKAKEKELEEEIKELVARAEACDAAEDKKYKEKTGYEIPEELKYKKSRLAKIKSAKEALEKREKEKDPDKEISDKAQISFSDHDAPPVSNNKGEFGYKYNGQISVDSKSQIIVGEHLSRNANDKKEVKQALIEIQETAGRLPEKMSADNGYFSGENLEVIEAGEIDAYVAAGRGEKEKSKDKFIKEKFSYNKDEDCYICPNGKKLELKSETEDGKKIYKGRHQDCEACPLRDECCSSKKGEPRSISFDSYEELRQSMRGKMRQEESQEIYRLRKTIVEPVFGQVKNGGFVGFSLRGIIKVRGEFSLVCAVHNIKKIIRAIKKAPVSPFRIKMHRREEVNQFYALLKSPVSLLDLHSKING